MPSGGDAFSPPPEHRAAPAEGEAEPHGLVFDFPAGAQAKPFAEGKP